MSGRARLRPVGEGALSVELGQAMDLEACRRVQALDRALRERGYAWLRETVPTYRSLLVVFDPHAREEAAARLAELPVGDAPPDPGAVHELEVAYGGEDGPDLEAVARHCGLTAQQVVAGHAGREYFAFMLGFLPGFAYLGPLPPELETPRRATPRTRVPAGSVAVAGTQTGVYPFASPGGWNLIGRTAARLFDAQADPPARIAPGDRVRFRAVDVLPPAAAAPPSAAAADGAAIEVLAPGLLTTVQDAGRPGWRRLGVPGAGAWDTSALAQVNAALGNEPSAAALECTLQGPALLFLRTARFAVAGADLGAALHRADLGAWPVPPGEPVLARAGNVLRFTGRRHGCRALIGFAGGIAVPPALGSRSTCLAAGFGGASGRPLRAGDQLALHERPALRPPPRGPGAIAHGGALRVVLGPQDDHFEAEEVRAFLDSAYELREDSDRTGCRLRGRRLAHRGPAEIVTDGMLPGCIQVPPDGVPIVMGPDGPTTGGYPKIAAVIAADVPRLGQLAPGDAVRFRAVTPEEAVRALEVP